MSKLELVLWLNNEKVMTYLYNSYHYAIFSENETALIANVWYTRRRIGGRMNSKKNKSDFRDGMC